MSRTSLRSPEQEFAAYNWLKVSGVAERWAVSDQHVIDLVNDGELQAIDVGRGRRAEYRISPASVLEYEKRKRIRPKKKGAEHAAA